jgi:hypothetical protein
MVVNWLATLVNELARVVSQLVMLVSDLVLLVNTDGGDGQFEWRCEVSLIGIGGQRRGFLYLNEANVNTAARSSEITHLANWRTSSFGKASPDTECPPWADWGRNHYPSATVTNSGDSYIEAGEMTVSSKGT